VSTVPQDSQSTPAEDCNLPQRAQLATPTSAPGM
jgi:hypothetical protein